MDGGRGVGERLGGGAPTVTQIRFKCLALRGQTPATESSLQREEEEEDHGAEF